MCFVKRFGLEIHVQITLQPISQALLQHTDAGLARLAILGLWTLTLYEYALTLLRLDERAKAYFGITIVNVPGGKVEWWVEAVGPNVHEFAPGDHVVACLSGFCGSCAQCLGGHPNLCVGGAVTRPGSERRAGSEA